jgi:hypothetical protein
MMVSLFNAELERRRANVDGLAAVRSDGPDTNRVNRVRNLRVGMRIEIAHRVTTDAVLAPNREIMAIDRGARVVSYSGADVVASTAHFLRRPRFPAGALEAISVDGVEMIRRIPAAASDHAGRHRGADWHLVRIADAEPEPRGLIGVALGPDEAWCVPSWVTITPKSGHYLRKLSTIDPAIHRGLIPF